MSLCVSVKISKLSKWPPKKIKDYFEVSSPFIWPLKARKIATFIVAMGQNTYNI